MSRREYRVMELNHGDGSKSYQVEYRINAHAHWLTVCTRDSLDLARLVIDKMKRDEIISKQVVWND